MSSTKSRFRTFYASKIDCESDHVALLIRREAQYHWISEGDTAYRQPVELPGRAEGSHRQCSCVASVRTIVHPGRCVRRTLYSRIIPSFPPLFDEFRGKRFALLWRGSRDGFGAQDFHGRCDGRANTLTLILDTRGNVFGGFTPLQWESRRGWKCDDSLKSFVFTLKNPYNIPARKFALRAEEKQNAINCYSTNYRNSSFIMFFIL
jgi:hypothetical protein